MRNAVLVLAAAAALTAPALADTTWVTVGSPFRENAIPFWGYSYDAFRLQLLYLQSEISQAGPIVSFCLNTSSDPPSYFYKVNVLLCHTTLSELTAEFGDNYAGHTPVNILSAETLLVGTGQSGAWFPLGSGFVYNDTDNLILEITWRGDAGNTVTFWRNTNGTNRRCYAITDTSKTGSVDNVDAYYARIGFLPVGIEAPAEPGRQATRLRVFPAVGRSRFRFSLPGLVSGTAQVISADGRLLWQPPVRQGEAVWNATGAPAGIYLCRVGSEAATITLVR